MRILVVDDSTTIRKRVRNELEALGHEVFEASDGEAAIDSLKDVSPDLITLDVDMPGIDGYETCLRIRAGRESFMSVHPAAREVPILFLTANDTEDARFQGYQAGADGFVNKPFMPGELPAEIDRATKALDDVRGHTVLIVDDSRTMRNALANCLMRKGLKVIVAENGKHGLEKIKENIQSIDLVLTDYMMPEMNGDDLCRAIRRDLGLRDLPVIFLSSFSEKDFMVKMFKAGASDFVTKPFASEELQARVIVHLRGKILRDQMMDKVTEMKRLHKEKDSLLSICSHDLRAPIAAVDGFSELLMMEDELPGESLEYVEHIKESCTFMLSVISDILDHGRLNSDDVEIELEPSRLDKIVGASVATVGHMAKVKGVTLSIENQVADAAQLCIQADTTALMRVFNNLLSNSIKFSNSEDTITVRLSAGIDGGVVAAVVDEGIGIPADKVDKMFDPMFNTSRVGTNGEKSFGFGMSIVKQITDRHDGTISVESIEGEGTTVSLSLPVLAG